MGGGIKPINNKVLATFGMLCGPPETHLNFFKRRGGSKAVYKFFSDGFPNYRQTAMNGLVYVLLAICIISYYFYHLKVHKKN